MFQTNEKARWHTHQNSHRKHRAWHWLLSDRNWKNAMAHRQGTVTNWQPTERRSTWWTPSSRSAKRAPRKRNTPGLCCIYCSLLYWYCTAIWLVASGFLIYSGTMMTDTISWRQQSTYYAKILTVDLNDVKNELSHRWLGVTYEAVSSVCICFFRFYLYLRMQ